MSLCTLAGVRAFIGKPDADTDDDALLTSLILRVSDRLAIAAGRVHNGAPCLEKADVVQYLSVDEASTHTLWLAAYPVVSVTEIKEALYGDYASVDALTENRDYQLRSDLGGLYRIGFWLPGVKTVKGSYIGGYTPPDVYGAMGYEAAAGEVYLPADIEHAAIMQAAFWFGRRDKLGLTGAGVAGGTFTTYARDELLPEVRQVMASYRRMVA